MNKIRRIAANYILLPGSALLKNGYVEIIDSQQIRLVDMGGKLRDLAGLEFYGGMLVPGYVIKYKKTFKPGEELLPLFFRLFAEEGMNYDRLAVVEGADLFRFLWTEKSEVRLL